MKNSDVEAFTFCSEGMTDERLDELEVTHGPLFPSETASGWHYCPYCDEMLIGPFHFEWVSCHCSVKMEYLRQNIHMCYSCSNDSHHEHRFKWVARLCGRIQKWSDKLLKLLPR
jgi:hypothetical protein